MLEIKDVKIRNTINKRSHSVINLETDLRKTRDSTGGQRGRKQEIQ